MILNKITGATAKTGKTYLKLDIDGKVYNYFGELGDVKEGDFVNCEFEMRGGFNNLKTITKTTAPVKNSQNSQIEACRSEIVLTRADRPHSYEFGKASARHKIYYNDVEELKNHIELLKLAGLTENEIEYQKIEEEN